MEAGALGKEDCSNAHPPRHVSIRELSSYLAGHEVTTVAEAEWLGLSDSELLTRAQKRFDVLITIDQGFAHQQNLPKFSIAVVVLQVTKMSDSH
jgi:Domain of unknown function (DUF5615)